MQNTFKDKALEQILLHIAKVIKSKQRINLLFNKQYNEDSHEFDWENKNLINRAVHSPAPYSAN